VHTGPSELRSPDVASPIPERSPGLELLRRVEAQLPVDRIDEVWLFPACTVGRLVSTVALLSLFHEDGNRRRVLTARWSARAGTIPPADPEYEVVENGIAPADRVARLVQGVLGRLADEFAAPPLAAMIHGDRARWADWLTSLPDTV